MCIGLLRHLAQLVDDMLGRRQIGVAHAQVDNVPSRVAGCGAHVIHFGDDIGRQALDAVELVGHFGLFLRCYAGRGLQNRSIAPGAMLSNQAGADYRWQ